MPLTAREQRALLSRVEQVERQLAADKLEPWLRWLDGDPPPFGLTDDQAHEFLRRMLRKAYERQRS